MRKLKINDAVKFITNKNNRLFIIILIIGIIFMTVIPNGGGQKSASVALEDSGAHERQLGKILSRIDGAGRVEVMITYRGGTEKNIAYETKTSSADKNSSQSEDRKAVISGGEPVILKEKYPEVRGVIVVAQGADSIEVRRALREAVTAVTGAAPCNVQVYKMK